MTDKLQLFNDKTVRTHWDAENEEWYFSVVDVVACARAILNCQRTGVQFVPRLK